MNEFINFIIAILAISFVGAICLFICIMANYKDEIWGRIEKNDKD